LGKHRRRLPPEIIHAELLDGRTVEQLLLQRIGQPDPCHHYVMIVQRRLEMRVLPHPDQRPSSRHRHRHSAQRSAASGFGSIEIGVGVEPEHADSKRSRSRPGMLQAGHQPRHRRAGRQQADGEVSVPLVPLDDFREMAQGHPQPLPPPILTVFLVSESGLGYADRGAYAGEPLLNAALRHGGGSLRDPGW
jgi:hypothetical protein